MIYDCFTFFNELEVLDIRLHELEHVVDRFVLVESTVTFTNKPKKLFFQENKQKFKHFLPKIIHIVVSDSPNVLGNAWIIEQYQTEAIVRGLKSCKPNDTILISCVDEIPRADKVKEWSRKNGKLKVFSHTLFYYYLNYLRIDAPKADGTVMLAYKNLSHYHSPYIARFSVPTVRVEEGGWHFSYIGGVNRIRTKIMSYAHQEFNNPRYNTPERIFAAIIAGKDLFGKGHTFVSQPYSCLPFYVQNHIEKFKPLLTTSNGQSHLHLLLSHILKLTGIGRDIIRKILVFLKLKSV